MWSFGEYLLQPRKLRPFTLCQPWTSAVADWQTSWDLLKRSRQDPRQKRSEPDGTPGIGGPNGRVVEEVQVQCTSEETVRDWRIGNSRVASPTQKYYSKGTELGTSYTTRTRRPTRAHDYQLSSTSNSSLNFAKRKRTCPSISSLSLTLQKRAAKWALVGGVHVQNGSASKQRQATGQKPSNARNEMLMNDAKVKKGLRSM